MSQDAYVVDPLGRDERHRQFGALLEFSPDAIVIVDANGLVRELNTAAERMLQTTSAPAVLATLRDLLRTPHVEVFDRAWLQLLAGHTVPRVTAPTGRDVGSAPPLDVTVAPIRSGDTLAGAVVILRDTTGPPAERLAPVPQTEEPFVAHALSEPVTAEFDGPAGWPGRDWLQRRLLEPPATGMERGVAVFDIDAFAVLLATYGPDVADAVLTRFGELLKSLDTPGAFAHWRADSFVWIVDNPDPVAALDHCSAGLRKALEEPFQVGDDRGCLTVSAGLATTALVAGGDLLAAAKDALQSAKEAGGSRAVYYDESMEASATSVFRLASDLRYAIEHEELRLHYQPIMDFATNEIAGVEALVRWERPGVGLLAPGSFIDVAERTGLIVSLGNWVVRTACNNALRLGSHSGGPRTMSINVSAGQLRDPGLITTLREAMVEGNCAPSTIVIEVTESVLLDDLDTVAASLAAIKALDVGLDLDDFGTGYSSLQYLRSLPIDRIKVDQGFVAGLGINGADTAIVASIIALAHALGLRSIAEGVETHEQLVLLREMGCDFAQGYLLSRPADMEAFTVWLDGYVPADVLPAAGSAAGALSRKRSDIADRRDAKANRRDAKADTRDTTATTRDTEATARDTEATARDTEANTRDTEATARDTEANTRDTEATARDAEANTRDTEATTRDTEANTRDTTATTRDTEAAARDIAADSREATADERERVANMRDAAASEREHVEDDRQRASGRSGASQSGGDSSTARLIAKQDRSRATAARLVEASDRTRASKGRDDASAERATRESARGKQQADPVSEDGDA